ncbi:hypothetical protein B7494_g2834 [Chlorociboria aeruginascens]|nr:hypothetical protein B7494_g2834 [Chlorociboria aeruginascens]
MTHSPSRATIPSAFSLNRPDHGSAPRLSGAKSHLFQPPRSPSASSSLYLTRSMTSTGFDTELGSVGRKRSRGDYTEMEDSWGKGSIDMDSHSPMPFVNTRYALAGGMDAPTLAAGRDTDMDGSAYSDVAYRRKLGGYGAEAGPDYFLDGSSRDANDRPSVPSLRPYHSEGWSKTAFQVVGGVVGKVWEFCKANAFGGFHAGGGKGYTMPNTTYVDNDDFWENEKVMGLGLAEDPTLPGRFPAEDFIPDYMDRATPDMTPPRAAKRRQVSANRDEITKNWVVVPPSPPPPTPSRPLPKLSRYSQPTASSASRRSTASRPITRPGLLPHRPLQSRPSHAGSPTLHSNHGASFASPRSSPNSKIPRPSSRNSHSRAGSVDSPAAAEARRWAALKRKEEREADESIKRLDAQLKAMIKQGKEALGTKVEILDDDGEDVGVPKWAV